MALTGSYQDIDLSPEEIQEIIKKLPTDPVSYTHLDVYKRQVVGNVADYNILCQQVK